MPEQVGTSKLHVILLLEAGCCRQLLARRCADLTLVLCVFCRCDYRRAGMLGCEVYLQRDPSACFFGKGWLSRAIDTCSPFVPQNDAIFLSLCPVVGKSAPAWSLHGGLGLPVTDLRVVAVQKGYRDAGWSTNSCGEVTGGYQSRKD
jgi:hypothetical protein